MLTAVDHLKDDIFKHEQITDPKSDESRRCSASPQKQLREFSPAIIVKPGRLIGLCPSLLHLWKWMSQSMIVWTLDERKGF